MISARSQTWLVNPEGKIILFSLSDQQGGAVWQY